MTEVMEKTSFPTTHNPSVSGMAETLYLKIKS